MSDSAEGLARTAAESRTAESGDLLLMLEQQIGYLIQRHRETRKTVDELRAVLSDRERKIAALEQQIGETRKLRNEVVSRVDALIVELDRLQADGDEALSSEVPQERQR